MSFWTAVPVTAPLAWWIWKLIPVAKVEGLPTPSRPSSETPGPSSPPSYDRDTTRQPSADYAQHAESEHDDFGTIVTKVTIVTTRERYRVEGTE